MPNDEKGRKVRVFAAYQLGVGPDAKMIGDGNKNRFNVTFAETSHMIKEIEAILKNRHAKDVNEGRIPIIHHFQLIHS